MLRFISIFILFFLFSCGGTWESVKRGLTGQKKISTDEFLVKKKDPLIQPPNFHSLPVPGSEIDSEEEEIESILSIEQNGDNNEGVTSDSGTTEDNILKRITTN